MFRLKFTIECERLTLRLCKYYAQGFEQVCTNGIPLYYVVIGGF
jgi:hypothetical protein